MTAALAAVLVEPPRPQRVVCGLRWAQLQDKGPFPASRPRRSALKRGLAFERHIGRLLRRMIDSGELFGELRLGQWILFTDFNGVGHAQPDAYLLTPERVLLVECKLTQSDAATPQMLELYAPLLRCIYELPVVCLQVCKNLRYVPKQLVTGPAVLLAKPTQGVSTWHVFD